ncbi:MAG: ECF transporter S component [Clostridia bacterium]|nr:ECF transporter S component [Clostridia bacterium]
MKNQASSARSSTLRLCVTALFMALNIAMSSFGIPVPGGHFYLNDIVICTAAIILDPISAFVVGGVGSFLGDLFFYPLPMFVSLVTHGLQAVVISLFSHYVMKKHRALSSGIGVLLGAVIMVVGYSLGRAFIYSTPEYAILKLPYQILQASIGAIVGMILCFKCGLINLAAKYGIYPASKD